MWYLIIKKGKSTSRKEITTMFKIVATTRKGNLKKVLRCNLSYEDAKRFLRDADWFHVDHLGRTYDLTMEAM